MKMENPCCLISSTRYACCVLLYRVYIQALHSGFRPHLTPAYYPCLTPYGGIK